MRKALIFIAAVSTVAICFLAESQLSRFDLSSASPGAQGGRVQSSTATAAHGQSVAQAGTTFAQRHGLQGLTLSNHIGNAYQYVLELLASLPSGTSLDQSQFAKALGNDAATFLQSIKVTHIDSLNNTVHVQLSAVYSTTVSSAQIRLDNAVSFSYSENAAGTLICDSIVGIEVNASALFGWMPVKHVEISHDTAGDTIIEVEVSSLLGTIKRTIKLDPDGKTIP